MKAADTRPITSQTEEKQKQVKAYIRQLLRLSSPQIQLTHYN